MSHEEGERVGAILSSKPDTKELHLLGYGVYAGKVVPPHPIGIMGVDHDSWESLAEWMNAEPDAAKPMHGGDWTADDVKMGNPLVRLDSGVEVWGAECWWGPEEKVKATVEKAEKAGYTIVDVDASKTKGMIAYAAPE